MNAPFESPPFIFKRKAIYRILSLSLDSLKLIKVIYFVLVCNFTPVSPSNILFKFNPLINLSVHRLQSFDNPSVNSYRVNCLPFTPYRKVCLRNVPPPTPSSSCRISHMQNLKNYQAILLSFLLQVWLTKPRLTFLLVECLSFHGTFP